MVFWFVLKVVFSIGCVGLLHDKRTLRSSRILGKMEVEEPWLGLWLPLNYQVDTRTSLAYDTGIWGEFYRLFAAKFLPWLVFWFVLKVVFSIGCVEGGFCG